VHVTIGSRISAARKARGITQQQLANRADMSLNGIALLEQGVRTDPHYSTLVNIARALGVTVAELTGEAQEAPLAEAPSSRPQGEDEEWRRGTDSPLSDVLKLEIGRVQRLEAALMAAEGEANKVSAGLLYLHVRGHQIMYERLSEHEARLPRSERELVEQLGAIHARIERLVNQLVDDSGEVDEQLRDRNFVDLMTALLFPSEEEGGRKAPYALRSEGEAR
jgi:transcriptional regulator with XRE-family HTH domain